MNLLDYTNNVSPNKFQQNDEANNTKFRLTNGT